MKGTNESGSEFAVVEELENHEDFDFDHLAGRLEGRSGFRSSKPTAQGDGGLEQFVWRMARFQSSIGDSMPVMATFWLQDWCDEELDSDVKVTGVLDDEGKAVLRRIDDMVDEILVEHFGRDPSNAAKSWSGRAF